MAAVSNASPLRYFIVIHRAYLLPQVLGPITIPHAVLTELTHVSAPFEVRRWFEITPGWLSIQVVDAAIIDPRLTVMLDEGESEAIQLALNLQPDFILIDERLGRREAKRLGFNVIGALGVLREAHRLGLLADPIRALTQQLLGTVN